MSSLIEPANPPLPKLPRGRLVLVLIVLAGIGALTGWIIWNRWEAHKLFQQAQLALRHDQLPQAKQLLESSLQRRSGQAEVVWLLARTLRRNGDLDDARKQLAAAEALGFDRNLVGLERVLIRCQEGAFAEEEPSMRGFLTEDHPEAAAALEVLTVGYFLDYRVLDGAAAAKRWTVVEPESPKAWKYLAKHYELLRNKPETIRCYAESLKWNPEDQASRFEMVRLLISEREPRERIEPELEKLKAGFNDEFRMLFLRGQFAESFGENAEARKLYDQALKLQPESKEALYFRGRFELDHGSPSEAKPMLKKLVELAPNDVEFLYTYFRCLSVTGPESEAKEIEARWTRTKDDLTQLGDLTKKAAEEPNDPEWRRQIGAIFLRNGREQEGVRWLQQALKLNPKHVPTHRTLAEYYTIQKKPEQAELHKRLAGDL